MSVSACVCLYKYRHVLVVVRLSGNAHNAFASRSRFTLTLIRSEVRSTVTQYWESMCRSYVITGLIWIAEQKIELSFKKVCQ